MAGRPSFWRDRRLAGLSGSCSQPCSKEMVCWGAGLASPSGVRAVGPGEQLAIPLCRWRVRGRVREEPEARPECRRSFCFILNPPLTQHRLLADTLPQVCGTCCWERGARGQIRELIRLFRISQKGRPREWALPVGLAVWVRQARTWDPLPECSHLDNRPSEQHNTKKL